MAMIVGECPAVAVADGHPIRVFMSAGPVSDYTGAAAFLGNLLKAEWLLADHGYDADWFGDVMKDKGKPLHRRPEGSGPSHQA